MTGDEPPSGVARTLIRLERLQALFEQAIADLDAAKAAFDAALLAAERSIDMGGDVAALIGVAERACSAHRHAERQARRVAVLVGQLIARIIRHVGAAASVPGRRS